MKRGKFNGRPERGQPCPRVSRARAWLSLLLLLAPLAASAHEDLLARIALLSEVLRTNVPSAEVMFQRAEIYRLHLDWDLALRDYDPAAPALTNDSRLALGRALTLSGAGKPAEARQVFDEGLRRWPTNVSLRLGRARVLAELGSPSQALDDFNTALAYSANPGPEDYLERAKLQAAVSGPAAAVNGLDEGLSKLGWTLTLQRLAVDYARAAGDSAGALARLETILERANRKEIWLALKGEILQQAGRKFEARATYEDALKAIGELPPRLVRAGVVVALQTRVEAALAGLKREGGTNQADH